MTTKSRLGANTLPSATPADAELEAWAALSRDEQVNRYREKLTHPDCSAASDDEMEDVLAAARQRAASHNRG